MQTPACTRRHRTDASDGRGLDESGARPIGAGNGCRVARVSDPPSRFAIPALALLAVLAAWLWPAVAVAFEEAEVRAIVGNVKTASDYPGSGGVWMARQRTVEIDGVGNASITEHLIARVFDPAWAERRFRPFHRNYSAISTSVMVGRARVWTSRTDFLDLGVDGFSDVVLPAAEGAPSYQFLRERRIHFPELPSGSVVEIRLHWTDRVAAWDYTARWLEEVFGDEDPVVEQQLVLTIPQAASIFATNLGPEIRSQRSSRGGIRRMIWMTGHLPAGTTPELIETPWSRVPGLADTLSAEVSRIVISTYDGWEHPGEYYGRLWEQSWSQRDISMDRVVADLRHDGANPEEVARRLELHVQRDVRTIDVAAVRLGMRPADAGVIARERAGTGRDKACYLVSLLRLAGIHASPVLVRARPGEWDPQIVSLAQLDRYVVRARVRGADDLWLDPLGDVALPPGSGLLIPAPAPGRLADEVPGLVGFPGIPRPRG